MLLFLGNQLVHSTKLSEKVFSDVLVTRFTLAAMLKLEKIMWVAGFYLIENYVQIYLEHPDKVQQSADSLRGD